MNYQLVMRPDVNVDIPWDYWSGPSHSVVDLYAEHGKKSVRQPPVQNYGRLVNKKWAVCHKPANRVPRTHANW